MTTFSSKGVIHSDKTVDVQKFIPPVQTLPQAVKKETGESGPRKDGASVAPQDRTPSMGPSSRNWTPVSQEESAFRESAGILEGARHEAKQLMMKSNKMAEDILREAREQAEEIKKNAARDGYQSGYEEGVKEGVDKAVEEHGRAMEAQMEEYRQNMEEALSSVDEAKEQCLRTYLDELKDCSVAVAEKVIHISLKSSGEVIKRMIIAETEKLKKTAWVKIYMEKTDYEMMLEADADIISELSRLSDNIKFIVMNKEDSGNCIIEMPEEIIDISVDTQLENIKEILQNIRI